MENQNDVNKSKRGGARQGAGRPKGRNTCCSISLRIPEDVAAILDRQEKRSQFIIEAIRAYAKDLRDDSDQNSFG